MSDLILWLVQPHYTGQEVSILSLLLAQWFHIRTRSCEVFGVLPAVPQGSPLPTGLQSDIPTLRTLSC